MDLISGTIKNNKPMKVTYIIVQDINTPDRTGETKDFEVEFTAQIHGWEHSNEVGQWANGAVVQLYEPY